MLHKFFLKRPVFHLNYWAYYKIVNFVCASTNPAEVHGASPVRSDLSLAHEIPTRPNCFNELNSPHSVPRKLPLLNCNFFKVT
jgi:hypothetical protein